MRLISFESQSGADWGSLVDGGVVERPRLGDYLPFSQKALVAGGDAWPAPGDTIEIEIEGIGLLSTPVTD